MSGDNTVSVKIVLPDGPIVLTNSEKNSTLIVSDWSAEFISDDVETSTNTRTQEIAMGATLYVGNKKENPAGVYAGTYAITFMYN